MGFVGILEGGPLDGEHSEVSGVDEAAVVYAFVCQHTTGGPCDLREAALDRSGEDLSPEAADCVSDGGSHWFFRAIVPGGDRRQLAYDFDHFDDEHRAVYHHRQRTPRHA